MPLNRNRSWLAIGLVVTLLALPSFGQNLTDVQLFAPADVSTYGTPHIRPNEGFFFQFDGLYWYTSPPKTTPIGFPGLTREVFYGPDVNPIPNPGLEGGGNVGVPDTVSHEATQNNTLDTSSIKGLFNPGTRFEFGRIEDNNGWLVSTFRLLPLEQDFLFPSANIVFQDEPFGPAGMQHLQGNLGLLGPVGNVPLDIYNIAMTHTVDMWNVEVMYLHRFHTCHDGGTFEFFAGPRYMEFNDSFTVQIGSPTTAPTIPSILAGSEWDSFAENHIIGGQLGGRWFKKQGRWMFNAEGRFTAGLNCQNIHQEANFGPAFNPGSVLGIEFGPIFNVSNISTSTSTYDEYPREFTPIIELRLEARYQVTRAISFHAGWTGMWLDGIARGDAVIDYTVHSDGQVMGIDLTRNREDVFINGLTIGFDVNR